MDENKLEHEVEVDANSPKKRKKKPKKEKGRKRRLGLGVLITTIVAIVVTLAGLAVYNVFGATLPSSYEEDDDYYYYHNGTFYWYGTSSKTEYGGSWYTTPKCPETLYSTDIDDIQFSGYVENNGLGFTCYSVKWTDGNSADPKYANNVGKYIKQATVQYRRAKTTPTVESVQVQDPNYVNGNDYWFQPGQNTRIRINSHQDQAANSVQQLDDWIKTTHLSLKNSSEEARASINYDGSWDYFQPVSDLDVKYNWKSSGSKGYKDWDTTFQVYLNGKNQSYDVREWLKSQNGKTYGYVDSGINLRTDGDIPTLNSASISNAQYVSGGTYWTQPNRTLNVSIRQYDAGSGNKYSYVRLSGSGDDVRSQHDFDGATDDNNQLFTDSDLQVSAAKETEDNSNYGTVQYSVVPKTNGHTYDVQYYFQDNVGNVSSDYSSTGMKIAVDGVAPSIGFSENGNPTYAKSHSTKVTVSDTGSGVNGVQYAWSTSSTTTPSSWTTTSSGATLTTPSSTGTYYLWIKATDNVGNSVTSTSNAFKVDQTLPSVSANPSSGDWENTPYAVTPSYSDSDSGVDTKQYAWSTSTSTPSSWSDYSSGTITQPGTGTYYLHLRAVDNAGNEKVDYFGPYKYESTDPTGTLTQTPTGWTNGDVTLNLTSIADGGGSGYYRTKLPNGNYVTGTSASQTVSANGSYSFVIYDNAGNSTTKTQNVTNIDKTAPSVSFNPNGNSTYAQSYSTKVTVSDSDSGINTSQYAWSNSNTTTPSSWTDFSSGATLTSPSNSGTYYLWVKVVDNAGNTTITKSNAFQVDNTNPTASTSQTPTSWTNGNVTLTLTNIADTGGSGYKNTRLPDGTYVTTTSATYTATANGTYDFVIYDNAGNATTKSFTVSNIDKTKPVISYSQDGNSTYEQSQSTKVTVSDGGGSGINTSEYAWSTSSTSTPSSWTSLTSGTTLNAPTSTGTYYLWVRVTDGAGNVTTDVSGAFKVDNTLPTFSANPSSGNWTNSPYVVTPTYSDGDSGVKTKQYAWATSTSTPTTWITYSSGTLTQPGAGTYYLHYRVVDKAGNSQTGYVGPYRYENTDPTASTSQSTSGWTNGNITLNVTNIADDGGSGYYRTKLPDGSYVTSTSATYTATANGTYSFVIYDNAGNTTIKTFTINTIDKNAPTADLSQTPTSWTNGDVTLKLTNIADSGGSGYYRTKLPDGTFITSTSVDYTVSANGTYQFTVYDQAENATVKSITVKNIDKVKPQGSVSYSTTNATNSDVVVTLNATDADSGVKTIQLPNGTIINGSTATYTVSANGKYSFVITDVAGNETVVTASVDNIDKTPPSLMVFPSEEEWTNKSIIITAIASDEGGISRIVLPNGDVVNDSTAIFTVTGNGSYTFTAYDSVGNKTTKTLTVDNYDGDKPTVKIEQTSQTNTQINVRMTYGD